MSKITKIQEQVNNSEKVNVFIDNNFCTGIRKRTFQAMNLDVGSEISCSELKEKESFFWKNTYNVASWEREKVRLNIIKQKIEENRPDLSVIITGFGADSTSLLKEHPDEKGIPDLNVVKKESGEVVFKIEVTGTETMRGTGYWVRPDKLKYSLNHPSEKIYTALHYSNPKELIRFIKNIPGKEVNQIDVDIRGAIEHYCVFNDDDLEVLTLEEFLKEIEVF